MGNVEHLQPYLEPIRKSVTVRRTPAEAFEVFTARLSSWWPTAQFSIYQAGSATCGIEPRVGGDIFEVSKNGDRCIWGNVITWEPPHRFAMTWHPGREPETAQEVELRFIAIAGGTRVELEHRGWTKLGAAAAETRAGYEGGWATVFDVCFLETCS